MSQIFAEKRKTFMQNKKEALEESFELVSQHAAKKKPPVSSNNRAKDPYLAKCD